MGDINGTVWGGGGGQSRVNPLAIWQRGRNLGLQSKAGKTPGTMRLVPDASQQAAANKLTVCGQKQVLTGTSFMAPWMVGLVARLIEANGGKRIGLAPLLTALYENVDKVVLDVTTGNNGTWLATPGWDGPSGLGAIVNVTELAKALKLPVT
jgi:kumamolisin